MLLGGRIKTLQPQFHFTRRKGSDYFAMCKVKGLFFVC